MRYRYLLLVLLASTGLYGCQRPGETASRHPLTVAIVGDGVPSARPTREDPIYPLNRAQGAAMFAGAAAAWQHSPRLQRLRNDHIIEIQGFNDGGSQKEAARIAHELSTTPSVLAVIGHATSGTTRAAAWIYAGAGIPLLMPIATSPKAALPPDSDRERDRLLNAFRLPPSDHRVQAPVVAFLAKEELGLRKAFFIRDMSPDASEYSGPLFERITELLRVEKNLGISVNVMSDDFDVVARKVRAQGSDSLVFVGYGTTAKELLTALRRVYADTEIQQRPKLIFTDGAMIEDLEPHGFVVYLTFPLPPTSKLNCAPEEAPGLAEALSGAAIASYQLYGYDAMLLVGRAVAICLDTAQVVDRECVIDQLSTPQNFGGACLGYSFKAGENALSEYHLYSNAVEGLCGHANDATAPIPGDQLLWCRRFDPNTIFRVGTN